MLDYEKYFYKNNFDEFHFIKDNDFFIEIYEDEFYHQIIKPSTMNDKETIVKESNDINEFLKYLKQRFVENKIKEIEKDFKNCWQDNSFYYI